MKRLQTGAAGFSLVEIMVVVVIMGLMATTATIVYIKHIENAKKTKAATDLSTIVTALDLYYLANGNYPTTEQGLKALTEQQPGQSRSARPDLRNLNEDPWGTPYIYRSPGKTLDFDLLSAGPDREEGTDDDIRWAEN